MDTETRLNTLKLVLSPPTAGTCHVTAFVDGIPLTGDDTEKIDVPFALLPSIDKDGYYFFVTCECGDAGCAGYMESTAVTHIDDVVRWVGERPK